MLPDKLKKIYLTKTSNKNRSYHVLIENLNFVKEGIKL